MYQTFRGADVNDALAAVRASLGEDALIQSTRHVTNGRLGGFGRNFVEIVAAPALSLLRAKKHPFSADIAPEGTRERSESGDPRTGRSRWSSPRRLDPAAVEAEIGALRRMLEELIAARPPRERARALLHAAGIEGALASDLARGASKTTATSPARLRSYLMKRVAERFVTRPGLIDGHAPQIISCVGATGVGKTTTLAKLAAKAQLEVGRRVGVITLDTFRVGAVDQWRRYAKLLGVPFGVAKDRASFLPLLAELRADLVLVDTAGRSPADPESANVLDSCLAGIDSHTVNVLLVLPAWLRARDAERTLAVYGAPRPTGLVVTKLDETLHVGGVLHAAAARSTPFVYLCDGPRVPEDIHDATSDLIADAVLPEHS